MEGRSQSRSMTQSSLFCRAPSFNRLQPSNRDRAPEVLKQPIENKNWAEVANSHRVDAAGSQFRGNQEETQDGGRTDQKGAGLSQPRVHRSDHRGLLTTTTKLL